MEKEREIARQTALADLAAAKGPVHRLFAPVLHEGGLRGWFTLLLWTLLVGAMLVIVFWFRTIGNMNVETDFYWTYVPVAKALLAGRLLLDNFRGP